MRDGYLKWSNIPPPAMASGGGLKTLERTPGHQSAYLAVGKAPCPPPGDVSYVGTMDIPTKKFVEIMSLWKAITATEASFTKFFGGEDVVAKSKPLTAVRNRLFLSRHPQDQRVISSIEREKFGLMDWIIPTYGISIGFDDDGASYAIIVRDGIGGLSFQRIDEAIY